MTKFEDLEKQTEKAYSEKDKKDRPRMPVSGKAVFRLQELIRKPHDSSAKRKNRKKN